MLAQHALAPTVDGRHSSLVHPLGGDVETSRASGPLLASKLFTQLLDQGIRGFDLATEEPGSLCQTGADTIAQLFGGRIGEGHDENLRR